jgi:CheY-like chemotaxis protein
VPARILVIEDNAANLDLMVYLLQAFGYSTYAARNGQEGLEMAASGRPDLIVCDVHMPKLDGYEVVQQLKKDPALHDIPVIAVTALAMVGDRDRVLQAGFDGYVSKPIDPERFVKQISPYLEPRNQSLTGSFSAQSAAAESQPCRKAKILAVDDVPADLDQLCRLLDRQGYKVIAASGGNEALEKAREERPDLILSDIGMKDGSGFDFVQSVRADPQLSSVPLVFITSSMTEELSSAKNIRVAIRILIRPFEPEKLFSEIAACLPYRKDRA